MMTGQREELFAAERAVYRRLDRFMKSAAVRAISSNELEPALHTDYDTAARGRKSEVRLALIDSNRGGPMRLAATSATAATKTSSMI